MKQVGAVITFPEGVSQNDAEAYIRQMANAMASNHPAVVFADDITVQVREFEPEYGGPVWYVP